jgi:hypothetical protein
MKFIKNLLIYLAILSAGILFLWVANFGLTGIWL